MRGRCDTRTHRCFYCDGDRSTIGSCHDANFIIRSLLLLHVIGLLGSIPGFTSFTMGVMMRGWSRCLLFVRGHTRTRVYRRKSLTVLQFWRWRNCGEPLVKNTKGIDGQHAWNLSGHLQTHARSNFILWMLLLA